MKRSITEIIFLFLLLVFLCPSIALLIAASLYHLLDLPRRNREGQILGISSIALIFAIALCLQAIRFVGG